MRLIAFILSVITTLAYVGVFLYILMLNLVPSGIFEAEYTFDEVAPFISQLEPRGRVSQEFKLDAIGNSYQEVVGEPVYAMIQLPRSFDDLLVTIRFKNATEQIIELGLAAFENQAQFTLNHFDHQFLNSFIEKTSWSVIREGEMILAQRNKKYDAIDEFLSNPPQYSEIAAYGVHFTEQSSNNVSLKNNFTVPFELVGGHKLRCQIQPNKLFEIGGLFTNTSADPQQVKILINANNEAGTEIVKTINPSEKKSIVVGNQFGATDIVTVVIQANRHIRINDLKSKNEAICKFTQKINVGALNKPLTLFVNADRLRALSADTSGTQIIDFAQKKLDVHTPQMMMAATSAASSYLKPIAIPNGNIQLHASGDFVSATNHFFSHQPVQLKSHAEPSLDKLGINYVIAKYTPPAREGQYAQQHVGFNLNNIISPSNMYRLILSMPYADEHTLVEFESIKIRARGEKMTFNTIIGKIFNRLR